MKVVMHVRPKMVFPEEKSIDLYRESGYEQSLTTTFG